MGFAAPLGLLALLSVAIPVLLHLRRKPARPIWVGTIRYLEGSRPHRRTGARISELLLLLVRAVLLALVATALAKPFVPGDPGARPRSVAMTIDSATDVWTTLRELEDTLPAGSSVALTVPDRVTVSGNRPFVTTAVTIRTAAQQASPPRALQPRLRRIAIVAPPARSEAVRHLRAAFTAVASMRGDSIEVTEGAPTPDSLSDRWVIWLSDSSSAALAASAGATVLTEALNRVPAGIRLVRSEPGVFARRQGRGVLYELDGRFEALRSSGALPELIAAIWPGAPAGPARLTAAQLQPAHRSPRQHDGRTPLATPLYAVAAVVFLLERMLAHRGLGRSRSAAA